MTRHFIRCDLRPDDGFTLAELMVVILIIGVLIVASLGTFIGARSRAQDRAAQSSLHNTLTAAKIVYTDAADYTHVTANSSAALKTVEPSLDFEPSAASSTGPKSVSLKAPNARTLFAAAFSDAGKCWYARDVQDSTGSGGTTWAVVHNVAAAGCTAEGASAATLFKRDPGAL